MKKILVILSLSLICVLSSAQKKNGTVYSEHETIDKTVEMWTAFVNGDEEKLLSLFEDSVFVTHNGEWSAKTKKRSKAYIARTMKWFNSEFEDLSFKVHTPAYPDAIEYKDGGVWVQDWIVLSGISKSSGIVLDVPYHNLYSFSKSGKIQGIIFYYENDVYRDIQLANTEEKNGTIYKNHPYIVTVRKLLNAIYVKKDFDEWISYYSPDVTYWNSTMKWEDEIDFEQLKALGSELINNDKTYKLTQIGYPDCMHYGLGDMYVVYAWWNMEVTDADGESIEYPMMTSHYFNGEGKVNGIHVFYSSNHLEK